MYSFLIKIDSCTDCTLALCGAEEIMGSSWMQAKSGTQNNVCFLTDIVS
ncbi:MAG: hypothetical protein PHS47_02575 [Methanocellales archaeon]|nr:hypothetical protein [Methanocellales archaeon]